MSAMSSIERNFVRIRKANSDEKFTDNVMAEPGEEYEVQIFSIIMQIHY